MEIKIAKGSAVALIDDEDFEIVSQYSWSRHSHGYAVRNRGGERTLYMHRLVLGLTGPRPLVDHINRNPLDNRKVNLRLANHSINGFNMSPRPGRRFKGVCWDKARNKWHASIGRRNLGRFDSEEAAAHAYEVAARDLVF